MLSKPHCLSNGDATPEGRDKAKATRPKLRPAPRARIVAAFRGCAADIGCCKPRHALERAPIRAATGESGLGKSRSSAAERRSQGAQGSPGSAIGRSDFKRTCNESSCNKFRDAIAMRMGWTPADLPKTCHCGVEFTTSHAFSCPFGGFPTIRHNETRDLLAT